MRLFLLIASLLASAQLLLVPAASAQYYPPSSNNDPSALLQQTNLGPPGQEAAQTLPIIIGNLVRVALSLLGIIFLVLTVYAGFLYLTSRGESDAIKKAKGILTSSIIGLVIVILAYAITSFVLVNLLKATGQGSPYSF